MKRNYFKKNILLLTFLCLSLNLNANHNYFNRISSPTQPTTSFQYKIVSFFVGLFGDTDQITKKSSNLSQINNASLNTLKVSALAILDCPADISVDNEAGFCGATVNWTEPISDDPSLYAVVQITGPAPNTFFNVGAAILIEYEEQVIVTGLPRGTLNCSFTVTVNDTEDPTISCPANITVSNDAGVCGAVVNYTAPVGADNCPGATTARIAGLAPGATFPIGTTTVTYEVTDAASRTAQCSFTVTVNDTEDPTISCPANITVSNDAGVCGAVVNYTAPVGADNCPGATTARIAGLAPGATFPIGTTTVTYEVTDAASRTAQCSFTVTVNDTEDPTISCPANITVSNDAGVCGAVVNYTAPVGADNCPGATTARIAGLAPGATFPIGTTTVTYEVTDAASRTAQCSFTVTVNDTEDPTISCPANITVSNDAGVCGAVVNYTAPVGADNCPGATTARIAGLAPGATFPIGTTTVTYEVTDAASRTAQCSFTVTVNDTEDPTISCPANITVSNDAGVCGAVVNYTAPVGADNCPGATTARIAGLAPGATFPIGTTTVTYEVTDAASRTAQCSFTVTVNDTEDPTISCPANITVSNDAGVCGAVVNYTAPVGADNCPGATTARIAGLAPGATFPIGTTTVTYEVTDAASRTAQCSFTVTVNDTEDPTISCPANITVSNDAGVCGAVVNYTAPVGADNCPGATTARIAGLAPGATFPIGTTTVTYEVTDAASRTAQCSFTVTVNDTEDPTISCPANITVSNDAGVCGAVVNYTAPVGADNCPGATTARIAGLAPGATFPIGTTTVTYEVTDAASRTAQCSFTVTVNDTEDPTISCPANITVSNDAGVCGAVVNYTAPVGADNCPGATTARIAGLAPGATFPIGTTTVTYEVTDAASRTAQCSFTVTVNDTEDPTISCPANITVSNDAGVCGAVVNYTAPVGADNCPGATTARIAGLAPGATFPIGTTTVTYEVTDAASRTAQCSFTVTVNDTEDPTISCPANITVSNDAGVCGAVVNYTAPVGADNCPGATTARIAGLAPGATFPIGTTTVTYEVTDAASRTAQCSFTVTVNDTEDPTISCPANITVSNDAGVCGAVVNYTAPVGADNCPGATTARIAGLAPGATFPIGTTTVTYEVTDAASRTAQCSFTVTVNDTEDPTISCPANITVSNDAGVCGAVVNYTAPVGADNCPGATTARIAGLAPGATFPIGTTTVTYEVTDAASRTAQCSFTVTVNDTEDPTISCPANITVSNDAGVCGAVVNYTAPVGADNCPGATTARIAGLAPGATFPIGTTTVTYEVTDAASRTAQCSFTVTVNDTEAPNAICQNISVALNPLTGLATITPAEIDNGSNDNCGTVNLVSVTPNTFDCSNIGPNTVTLTINDGNGNTDTCNATVTVTDASTSASVSITTTSTSICDFQTATFSIQSISNAGTNVVYNWKRNGVSIGAPNSNTYVYDPSDPSNNNGDIISLSITSDNFYCEVDSSNTITMTVNNARPVSFNINGPSVICEGTNATFSVNPAAIINGGGSNTYQWTLNGNNIGGATGTTYSTNSLVAGDVIDLKVSSNLSCANPVPATSSNPITIIVNPLPIATPITGPNSVCMGSTIDLNEGTPGTIVWNSSNPSVATVNGSGLITPVSAGSTNITYTVTDGNGCTSAPSAVHTVTVNALPSAPTTSPVTYCQGDTASALSATGSNLLWYTVASGGTGSATAPTPSTVSAGNTTYYVSQTVNNCEGPRASLVVTVVALPSAPSTSPVTYCQGDTASALTASGSNLLWYTVPTGGTGSATAPTPSTASAGNTTYYVSQTVNNCEGPRASLVVTVVALPSAPTTSPVTYCQGDTASALSATGSNLLWYTVASGGTGSATAPTPSTASAGNTTYYVSQTINNCEGPRASLVVTVVALPSAPSTNPIAYCIGATAVPLTATGQNLLWYNVPTGGTGSSTAPTPNTSSAGTTTYYVSQTVNGCEGPRASLAVTVNPNDTITLTSSAGSNNQNVCISGSNDTITNITYALGGVGSAPNITWSSTPTGITSSYNSVTKVFTISGNPSVSGTFTYTITTTDCAPVSATGTIKVFTTPPPVPTGITGPTGFCPPSSNSTFEITNVDPNAVSYFWTTPPGITINSGQGSNIINVSVTNTASSGDITVYAINPCGNSPVATYPITISSFNYADAGPDQYICTGTTTVNLVGDVGGAINPNTGNNNGGKKWSWSDNGAGGTFSDPFALSPTYTLPTNTVGPITVYLTTVKPRGTCDAASDSMQIFILPNPTANISLSGPSPICSGSSSQVTFTGTPNTTITYKINGGANQTINNVSGTVILPTGALTTSTTYSLVSVAYTTSPGCSQTATGSATITVDALPTVDAGGPDTVCQSASPSPITLSGASIGGGATTAAWSITSGGGTLSSTAQTANPQNVTYTPADNFFGTVTLTLTTNANGTCPEATDTRTITIDRAPTVEAGGPDTVCQSASPSPITLSGASIGGGATTAAWSITSGGGTLSSTAQTANPQNVTYTPTANFFGTVTLTLTTNANGTCPAATDTRTITIDRAPTVEAGGPDIVCQSASPSPITLSGASIGGGATTAAWSITSGGGTLSSTAQTANPQNVTYTPADNFFGTVTLTLTTNANGTCPEATDTRTITIDRAPTVEAGGPDTVCQSASPSPITLSGASIGGGATTAAWSITSGGGTLSSTAQTANPQNVTYTPTANFFGTVTLTLTTNANGTCPAATDTRTITIDQAPTVNAGTDQTICTVPSGTTTATMSANLGGSASSGTWTTSGSGTFNNNNINAFYTASAADINAGSVTLTYTTNDPIGPCGSISDSMILTIKEAVVITTQPQNVGVCVTEPASFYVGAIGDDLTYQWYKSPATPVSNTANISGATTNTLNFNQAQISDAGTYYLVVSGNTACGSVPTASVTLNVNQVINITDQPDSATRCEGSNITFTVAATGSIATYQWRKNGVNIGSANGTTLTLTNITTADAANYDVVISSPGGTCSEAYSSVAALTVTQVPTATISYATPFCKSETTSQPVTLTGTHAYTGGTFTASPVGLTINSTTGAITPSTSTVGTYTITYTIPASGGCSTETATTSVIITAVPTATISYAGTPFCKSITTAQAVTLNGTDAYSGGTYSSTAGLTLNTTTGAITPSTSTAGTYTVTYTIPASAGCSTEIATTSVTITAVPTATLSYAATPYCTSIASPQTVTLSGTGAYTGGTYTANPGGLTINAGTGAITPSSSTPGTYTVTYTIPASAGCGTATATTTVTITPLPVANISYSETAYCESDTNTYIVLLGGSNNGGGTYSSTPAGLSINSTNGTISPSSSNVGNYTISYTIPASGGCSQVVTTTTIEIEAEPDATFSYGTTDFCAVGADPTPSRNQTGGTFTASPAGLVINASTGQIDLDASTVGSYTVYYTFAAADGCGQVQESQNITIAPDLGDALLDGFAYTQLTPPVEGPVSNQILACHLGDGILTLHIDPALIPYIVRWEYNNGSGFQTLPDDGNPDGNVLTRRFTGLIGTTSYRVVFSTGSTCGNFGYSSVAYVSVIPPDLKPEPVSASPTEFCYGDFSTMTASVNYGANQLNSGGLFQTGQINTQDPDSWLVDGNVRGLSAANNNVKNNNWSGTNPHNVAVGGTNVQWNSGEPKFAIALGVLNQNQSNDPYYYETYNGVPNTAMTTLTTPIFSLMTLQDAVFTFDEAYVLSGPQTCIGPSGNPTNYPAGEAVIQISTDGGSTWSNIPDDLIADTAWRTGAVVTGTNSPSNVSGNLTGFNVNTTTVDLSDYFGQTQMRIRFVFIRNCESVWALDNIELPTANAIPNIEWTDQFGVFISNENTINYTPITPGYQIYTVSTFINGCRSLDPDGHEHVPLTVDMAYAGQDQTVSGGCGQPAELHAYDNTKGARANWTELNGSGNWINGLYTVPTDPAFDYAPTGATGEWSISSGPAVVGINWATENPADYFFPSITDPRAFFAGPGGSYTLTWTVHGAGGNCSDNVVVNLTSCATLDFDGYDDNVTFRNDFNLNSGPFSIEIWVKPDPTQNSGQPNGAFQTILSKRDETTYTTGYDLSLINNKFVFNWNTSNSLTHTLGTIGTNRWYHIAVTFDGTNAYKMYIDGILLGNANGPAPIANNFECIMGAMDRSAGGGNPTPKYFYSGWLDELRIWNVELSDNQIRHMMNQEILQNGANVRGAVVPIDIPGPPAALTWANLRGYYRMNQPGDIANGYLLANAGTRDGQMRNITTWQLENPPIPYTTKANGNWNTTGGGTPWTFGDSVWDYPNSTGIDGTPIDWNIVRTGHNVTSDTQDVTVLGLLVDANELTITSTTNPQDETNPGTGLWVTHYLRLDGLIDLVGESQLVQKRYIPSQVNDSQLEEVSSGRLERDQQGTANKFNYNYWSPPVTIQGQPNNSDYTINSVLRSGTNTNAFPLPTITWVGGYNGSPAPLSLARYWLWTYGNKVANTYLQWDQITENTPVKVGLGYTMKGSGNVTPPAVGTQNYVFTGKPNNGNISNPISTGRDALVGNPYPSAIDAHVFITDNGPSGTNSINGALYFWDHYQQSATHILAEYEGGYAVRNFGGGLNAVSPPATVDGYEVLGGTGSKVPGQYVPVGQGFFVTSGGSSGQVVFNNSQRVFQRETNDNSPTGSSFFRTNDGGSSKEKTKPTSNVEDNIKRLRIAFKTPDGAIRPLLLAFVPNGLATDGVDYGYDAFNYDVFPNDLSWRINNQNYVIQGVGDFDKTKQYPLDMLLTKNGNVEISLTDLENFDTPINVYVYDALLGSYTKINNSNFQMSLDANHYNNRFFIAFQQNGGTLSIEDLDDQTITVNYLSNSNEIYVKTINSIEIRQIYLINMIGQTVKSWNTTNLPMSNDEIRIPVSNISEGNYILKVETNGSTVNKKVIIAN